MVFLYINHQKNKKRKEELEYSILKMSSDSPVQGVGPANNDPYTYESTLKSGEYESFQIPPHAVKSTRAHSFASIVHERRARNEQWSTCGLLPDPENEDDDNDSNNIALQKLHDRWPNLNVQQCQFGTLRRAPTRCTFRSGFSPAKTLRRFC